MALIAGLFFDMYDVGKCDCCRVRPIDVVTCFSWLLTMLACGWLGDSAVIVRLTLISVTVVVTSCSLISHCSSEQHSESHLSRCVLFCFIFY